MELGLDLFKMGEQEARRALELDSSLFWAHINLGASLVEQYRLTRSQDPEQLTEAIAHYCPRG